VLEFEVGGAGLLDFVNCLNAGVNESGVVSSGDVVPGSSLALVEGNISVGGHVAVAHVTGEAASAEDWDSKWDDFLGEELGVAEDSTDVGNGVDASGLERHFDISSCLIEGFLLLLLKGLLF